MGQASRETGGQSMSLSLFKEKDVTIAVLMTTAIFMADLLTPLWYDVWVFYLVPLFFMYRSARRPYLFSAVVTLLIVTGLFLSHSDSTPLMHSAVNRITGILGGWGVSLLLMRLKHLHVSLLQSHEERYRSLSENMLEGFAYCRMLFEDNRPQDFIYLHVNSSFEKLTGLKNVEGKKVTEVIPGIREAHPDLLEIYGRVALTGEPEKFEIYLEPLAAWLSISVFSTEKEYFIAVFENITDRKKAEEELRSLSLTDELTGLYNRRGFFAWAEKLGKMAKRQKKGLFILYADLDELKKINDTWGHQEGDLALIDMANIFRATYRESDVIARIGGDEFVVIPVGTTGEDTHIVVARLQKSIDAHNANREKRYKLSMSWGLSYYDPENPFSIDELLSHADKLMYEQKRLKRNS
jgi:diguanylate cyclase (GGDEF)-like protein/PAS domain S-box-containing protein